MGCDTSAVVESIHSGHPSHATMANRQSLWNKWIGSFGNGNHTGTSNDSRSTWKLMDHLNTRIGTP